MFRPNGSLLRRALLLGLVAVAGTAMAQEGAVLGQFWPKAADQSKAPGWHAYVTVKDGVKYVQINDATGQPRTAIATANGQVMVLPVGPDAERTSATPPAAKATAPEQTVYDDGTVTIKATTNSKNVTSFVVAADCDIYHCSKANQL